MTTTTWTLDSLVKLLSEANAQPFTPARASGCGRSYVCVPTKDRKLVSLLEKACEALGWRFEKRSPLVGRNAINIGYDNGTGTYLAKSDVFATYLRKNGLDAYQDLWQD